MTAAANPYLTLIIAARNDSYAGGMLRRLQACIDSFVHQVEADALPSELILVDWNPPPDRPLGAALNWPATARSCTIRLITVSPAVHAKQRFGDRLPIIIHLARNVGVRRARGAFVLPTSADILFSDELVATFAMRRLDPAAIYRIVRHDVPEAVLALDSHDARIRYCREHVMAVHGDERSYRIPGAPPLFTNAAGDFTLMSRDMYLRLRGIPEEHEFHSMHTDSVFCYQAHAAGAIQRIFTEPCRMYHIDHGVPSWRRRAGLLERLVARLPLKPKRSKRLVKKIRKLLPRRSPIDRLDVPYLTKATPAGKAHYEGLIRRILEARGEFFWNTPEWGLGDEALDEQVIIAAR
jgi:hypothetical protein